MAIGLMGRGLLTRAITSTPMASLCIRWQDGHVSSFPYAWLRDNDPAGLDARTHQRTVDLHTDVPLDIAPTSTPTWSSSGKQPVLKVCESNN